MSDILKRLEATIRFDTVNGDSFERSIVNTQIREAIAEIKLYKGLLEVEQEDSQRLREMNQNQWERAEIAVRNCDTIKKQTAEKCAQIALDLNEHCGCGYHISRKIQEDFGVDV